MGKCKATPFDAKCFLPDIVLPIEIVFKRQGLQANV
jgi:hypothetical protein